jgi:hypothetical protein
MLMMLGERERERERGEETGLKCFLFKNILK